MGISPLVFGEKTSANRIAGFGLVLAGSLMMSAAGLGSEGSLKGYACGFLTAAAYVGMVVLNKKASSSAGLENPCIQLVAAFSTVLVCTLLVDGLPASFDTLDLVPILVLGIVNTGLGCLLYFTSLGRIEGQTVAICDYLEPASAAAFAAVFLGENVGPAEAVGIAVIAAGVLLGYKARGFRRKEPSGPGQRRIRGGRCRLGRSISDGRASSLLFGT